MAKVERARVAAVAAAVTMLILPAADFIPSMVEAEPTVVAVAADQIVVEMADSVAVAAARAMATKVAMADLAEAAAKAVPVWAMVMEAGARSVEVGAVAPVV